MYAFCVNPFCMKKIDEMCEAFCFLTDLWVRRGEDADLGYHIDNFYLNDDLIDAFFEKLQQKDRELSVIILNKIVYPCFQNQDVLENLCQKGVYWNDVVYPEASMFYYAFLKTSSSCLYLILSFSNKECWDKDKIFFKLDLHQKEECVDNLFFERDACRLIEHRFFPKIDLAKDCRFRKSSHPPVKGAIVYEEIQTGRLWYQDTKHLDHYEVFQGKIHIGEASLDGRLDTSKADSDKKNKI